MITNFSDLAMGRQRGVKQGRQGFIKATQLACVREHFPKPVLGIALIPTVKQGFDAYRSLSSGVSHI